MKAVLTMAVMLMVGLGLSASAGAQDGHGHGQWKRSPHQCGGPAPTEWVQHGVAPEPRACPLHPDDKVSWDRIAPYVEHARKERSGRQG